MKNLFDHAATTDGVTVRVTVNFLPEQSDPANGKWFWIYHIRIENASRERVQLMTRHWRITDAQGTVRHVDGEGVVGEQPVLTPGRSHDYVSGCPLTTPFGSMEGFYTFHREDGTPIDIILNPLDARCPAWSVFNDCSTRAEFHAAAESLVPHDGGGAEQFWVLAARTLFVETCLKLAEAGRGTNAALAHELMNADLSDLHRLVEDTMAGPISTPSAARMAESVRAVFNVNAKALQMLPEDGTPFSVREWVNGAGEPRSILFLSARYIDMSVLSQLLTLWLDTAINTLMAGQRSRDIRLWFLIDELGALHRLPSLEKGLQTARNFGGAIVTGIHAFAKLKEVYGENMAMTLSSLARTKLILGTADRETATWCSDIIGHREVREMEEGYSYGYNNARDAVSLTPRRQVVPLLLPDELMKLKNL